MLSSKRNRRRADVEAQRARVGKAARAVGKGLLWSTAIAGLVAGLGWVGLEAWRWATTTPRLAVERIVFEGLSHVREGELLRLSALSIGQSMILVDLDQAAEAMALHPWVKDVHIERAWPRTLRVQVIEHRPAALLLAGGLYLVDGSGVPFKRALPGDSLDLPVITGVDRDDLASGDEGRARVQEALEILKAWTAAGLEAHWPASEVRVEDLGLTLVAADGAEVQLGFGDFASKVKRLVRVREELLARGQRAARVDLGNRSRPGWVAVELLQ